MRAITEKAHEVQPMLGRDAVKTNGVKPGRKSRKGYFASKKRFVQISVLIIFLFVFATGCSAVAEAAEEGSALAGLLGNRSESIDIVILLTILSILPSILIMLTSFTRIIIVLSLVRNGMGMQQMPPNQVLIGLALFLTFFVMSPVLDEIKVNAYEPYVAEEINGEEAIELGAKPLRAFMMRQTQGKDTVFFYNLAMANVEEPPIIESADDIPMRVVIPAFITSEIKRGFEIGFYIYIPFIVIDMIVSSTLMAMGMMMLPPIVISLPFKILLFVMVDGWTLTVKMLVESFL